jgi:hypothetical protein
MRDLDQTENRVKFIVGMFKHYQPSLTIPEQIALLTLWEESCVLQEEYEMAEAILKEMGKIQQNPAETPQKYILPIHFEEINPNPLEIIERKEEYIKKSKPPFYSRFWIWLKSKFKKKLT